MSKSPETLESLSAYCSEHKRLIPMPERWNELYQLLRNTRQKPSGGWEPPLPLILAAWHHSLPLEKKLRFKEQLSWANDQGQIEEVGKFLRSLPENDWCLLGDI